jgi:hypothetical protein
MYLGLLNGLFLLPYLLRGRIKAAGLIYWFVLIVLFFFSAFRFRVGCDWAGYYRNFLGGQSLDYLTALANREPLWWLIQVAFNRWGLAYPSVNILTSAIFFFGIHALAKRQPDRLAFLVLLFPILIINMPMSGIRQAAAVGFLCLSLVAFIDRRPIRFAIWIVIGSAIHSSLILFILLLPLAGGQFSNFRIAISLFFALPGAAFILQTDNAQLAVDRYFDSGLDAFGAVFRVGILALSGLFFLLFLRRAWRRDYPKDFLLVNIGAWSMIFLLSIVPISTVISDRFGYYLVPIQTMIFARIPFLKIGGNLQLFSVLPYIGLLFVFAVWSSVSFHFQSCYLPYQSWLFGNKSFGLSGF